MALKLSSKIIITASILALCMAGISFPVSAAEAQSLAAVKEMPFKFYLDPALVTDMDFAKTALSGYVEDMNGILAKNTNRRLLFNPETDIILASFQPHSNSAQPPLPVDGFEIWAHAVKTSYNYSYGGYAGVDDGGAGVLAGLKWTKIYDPTQLSSADVTDYWTQVNNMLHELAHIFGAGIGEYYKLSTIQDTTGEQPLLNINIYDQNDSFWSSKSDFMTDPLLKNAALDNSALGRAGLLGSVKFSALTAAIISNDYRNELPTVDLSQINLTVLSADGSPLNGAKVKVWSVAGGSPYQSQLLAEDFSNAAGGFSFAWGGPANPHNSTDFLRLIKVYKDGYTASARYVSIYDADIEKQVNGGSLLNITIKLTAAASFEDVAAGDFAWQQIERLSAVGITAGCSLTPKLYCPNQTVTRGQMAVFLERSMKGRGFAPAVNQITFNDTTEHWARLWIEALAVDGVTSGCGNGNYCPDTPVTRAQMAVFLLRAKFGAQYTPPSVTQSAFLDVPANYWAGAWIEELKNQGITGGCGNGNYCPEEPVTRAQMAVFLTRAFNNFP